MKIQASFALLCLITACQACKTDSSNAGPRIKQAKAIFYKGTAVSRNVEGAITFTETSNGTTISGTLNGVPEGEHGFHIHEFGDLSSCVSAKGHYNPFSKDHGGPTDVVRHVGDLGNIKASSSGTATVAITDKQVKLSGEHNIVGRMLVVHEKRDDLGRGGNAESKKTGNAGARIACAVIGLTEEE